MWYFTWMLGLTMAILLAVVNAIWFEVQEDNDSAEAHGDPL
jgi:cytochrome bd-I ubiquinol oxidase subunit X